MHIKKNKGTYYRYSCGNVAGLQSATFDQGHFKVLRCVTVTLKFDVDISIKINALFSACNQ